MVRNSLGFVARNEEKLRIVVSYITLGYIPIALFIFLLGWLNDRIVDRITDYVCSSISFREAFKEK